MDHAADIFARAIDLRMDEHLAVRRRLAGDDIAVEIDA